jgi:hypothetical protein
MIRNSRCAAVTGSRKPPLFRATPEMCVILNTAESLRPELAKLCANFQLDLAISVLRNEVRTARARRPH